MNFTDPFCLCPVCVLVSEACELGSGVYDVYQAETTLRDPNASKMEKTVAVGLAAAGLFLPGGGYTKLNDAVDIAGDLRNAARTGNLSIDAAKRKTRNS